MIWSLSVYFLATKIAFLDAAPKLRYILFDPLTYEAKAGLLSAKSDSSNVEKPTTKTPLDPDTANFILSDSSGEFMENDVNVTEEIENKTSSTPNIVMTTTPTTSKKVDSPMPVLRSKSCFSCIGSLRTGEPASISLKSLPIYLRANENQKGYPKFGYEFDEAVCKLVNKRILCGYNKNTGTIPNSKEAIHVDADCHIRGDRIECGYGNSGSDGGKGGSGKRALKLQLSTEETETTFKLKDILEVKSMSSQAKSIETVAVKNYSVSKEIKSTSVDQDSVTTRSTVKPTIVIKNANLETFSTKAEPLSEEPTVSTTSAPMTTVTTAMTNSAATTDTNTEKNITTKNDTTTLNTEIDTEISSKIPFLSLQSIMKMSEDLEKIARQGSETETTEYIQAVTRCVEIADRIVCYNYKPRPTTPAAASSTATTKSP